MSALSPALATASGAPWADPLTPLESALTDCCLSYKQNAAISALESAIPNASHLLDSAHFEPACFDPLASLSPVTPLESALTKNTGGGGESLRLSAPLFAVAHHMRHVAPLSPVASVDCAYFLSPRGLYESVWQLCCLGEFLVISMIHLHSSEVVARGGLDFLCAGYFQWGLSRHMRVRFNAVVARANSAATFLSPRIRNLRIPRCSFTIPMTGPATAFRRRYNARPVIAT